MISGLQSDSNRLAVQNQPRSSQRGGARVVRPHRRVFVTSDAWVPRARARCSVLAFVVVASVVVSALDAAARPFPTSSTARARRRSSLLAVDGDGELRAYLASWRSPAARRRGDVGARRRKRALVSRSAAAAGAFARSRGGFATRARAKGVEPRAGSRRETFLPGRRAGGGARAAAHAHARAESCSRSRSRSRVAHAPRSRESSPSPTSSSSSSPSPPRTFRPFRPRGSRRGGEHRLRRAGNRAPHPRRRNTPRRLRGWFRPRLRGDRSFSRGGVSRFDPSDALRRRLGGSSGVGARRGDHARPRGARASARIIGGSRGRARRGSRAGGSEGARRGGRARRGRRGVRVRG